MPVKREITKNQFFLRSIQAMGRRIVRLNSTACLHRFGVVGNLNCFDEPYKEALLIVQ